MIFIAGISPKVKILDEPPRICPKCGLGGARFQRVDHYFTLFFIPLFPVKKGERFLVCNHCERNRMKPGFEHFSGSKKGEFNCAKCGTRLKSEFRYCPYCGHENVFR